MAVKTVQTLSGTIQWENSVVDSLGRPVETPQSIGSGLAITNFIGSGLAITNFWDGGINVAPAVTAPVDQNGKPIQIRVGVDAPTAKFNTKVVNPS